MSTFDEKELKTPEAPEELTSGEAADETLTLEDLAADVTEEPLTFTATLHFEFSDIFNAIEHIETEAESVEPEPELSEEMEATDEVTEDQGSETESKTESAEPAPETEPEALVEPEVVEDTAEPEIEDPEELAENAGPVAEPEPAEPAPELESDPETAEAAEPASEPDAQESEESMPEPDAEESESESDPETVETAEPETAEPAPETEPPSEKQDEHSQIKANNPGTKKLLVTVCILFAVIAASITIGLITANSMVKKANVANEEKIAEMQANIKEVNLSESLYDMAADQVIDDVAVPTYTLDELYALDLREKTGFTANDLAKITRKGLVGCEEAFVKAEETYGVNSIFLISIASLESAHGTMMFRPNNMFGYGRTGFSSKEECIMTVAKGLGTRYLPPGGSLYGGSPTLKGVNKRYAANPQWYYKVGKYMQGYYAELAAEKNGALDKFE